MEVAKALLERRTIRKFTQQKILNADIADLIEYARLAAYPANIQPLKFSVITNEDLVKKVFPHTKWAGYDPKIGPQPGEEPTAYILVLGDKSIKNTFEVEAGAAVTSMMLGAWDKGIASCWIGAINRKELMKLFNLSEDKYSLLYILALGYPSQRSRTCDITNDIKYFEDESKTVNVPKRSTDEIILDLQQQ